MLDAEFLTELKLSNDLLGSYLTIEKLISMVDYIIVEPEFEDDAERCYRLPFLACECFTSEQPLSITKYMFPDDGTYLVWDKILQFFSTPAPD
jgi:hypothetical protein